MHQVIARKYRPQRFDEVVSQDHVKRTIANAIDQRRIGHGYIFRPARHGQDHHGAHPRHVAQLHGWAEVEFRPG